MGRHRALPRGFPLVDVNDPHIFVRDVLRSRSRGCAARRDWILSARPDAVSGAHSPNFTRGNELDPVAPRHADDHALQRGF